MIIKRIATITLLALSFLIFVSLTNPQEVSLVVILIPFILLGIIFYNILMLVIERFFKKSSKTRRIKLFGVVSTVILVNFALLSSIGQLTPQDTILAVLITIVGGFYLYKFQIG